jgi:hypothetical protein
MHLEVIYLHLCEHMMHRKLNPQFVLTTVYIQQVSDAQVDTTSSNDKSSEEVEDVSENLKFLFFLWFDRPQLVVFRLGCLFLLWLDNALVLNRLNCVTCFKT